MRIFIFALTFLFLCSPVQADMLGNIFNKAKQAVDDVVQQASDAVQGNSTESQEQHPTPDKTNSEPEKSNQPVTAQYDHALVREIQQSLKDQGYQLGVVDGLYGKGTKKAIQDYQQKHGLNVDGIPTQALLDQLQSTSVPVNASVQSVSSAKGDKDRPEPTNAALVLAAVHYRPDALDNESTLKDILYTVHPETNPIMSNEFKWHKQKEQLKQQLLEEAKGAQLLFEVKPWNQNSIADHRTLELKQYDFDKSVFRVGFATGTTGGGILPAMLIPGQARLEKQYPQSIQSLSIDADTAEHIDTYFNHQRRILYASYLIDVTGVDLASGHPLPVVNFGNNQLKLYARKNTPAGNKMKTEYKFLISASIPYDKTILAKESAPKEFDNHKSADTDVVKNALINGIHLGMDLDKALDVLKSNGFVMGPPDSSDPKLGIRLKGTKPTEIAKGSTNILISGMNGRVYEIVEGVRFWPIPDEATAQKLMEFYKNKYIYPLKEARYSSPQPNGRIAFDDEKQSPYNHPIQSPHAEVILSDRKGISAHLNMTWKGLVGAKW